MNPGNVVGWSWPGAFEKTWVIACMIAGATALGGCSPGVDEASGDTGSEVSVKVLIHRVAESSDSRQGIAEPSDPPVAVPRTRPEIQLSFAPVVNVTRDAVVNIYTKQRVQARQSSPFLQDPFFGQFFDNRRFGFFGMPQERIQSNLGSGVIIHPDGYVITNHHVIKSADEIRVVFSQGEERTAEVILRDEKSDLAVLKVNRNENAEFDTEPLRYLRLADSELVQVGDLVLAIGNPFGVGKTVTSGIISGLARTTQGISDFGFFIQTDAAINPGNSGGALVNMKGELVGIPTAIFSPGRGANDIGFAIPSSIARVVINAALEGRQRVRRPWFGGETQNVTSQVAAALELDRAFGAIVRSLRVDGPAHQAGLRIGDIVTVLDGKPVPDSASFEIILGGLTPGTSVPIGVIRDGKSMEFSIALTLPPETVPRDETLLHGRHSLDGATVTNLSPAVAEELDISVERGVAISSVERGSQAGRIGLQAGDVIRSVNGVSPRTTLELADVLEASGRRLVLTISRGQRTMTFSRF